MPSALRETLAADSAPADSASLREDEPHAYAAPAGGEGIVIPGDEVVVECTDPKPAGAGGDEAGNLPPVSPGRANAVLVALALGAFLMVTNEIAPMGLLQPMHDALGIPESRLGFASTMFAASVMVATLPLALLTTRMVRRWVIVAALTLFTVGALVGALAPNFTWLLVSRGLTGASHALFWAVVTPAAAGMFPLKQRGKSVARLLLGASAAGVIGLPAETYLAQRVSWHAPFWVLMVAGALLAVTVAVLMPSFRTTQATVVRGEIPSPRRFTRIMGITLFMTSGLTMTWAFFAPFFTEVTDFADATVPWLMFFGGFVGVVTTWLVARYLDRWPVKSVAVGFVGLLSMLIVLAFFGDVKPVAIAMLALQGCSWSIIVAAMVNWALRHSPWTADLGNGTYATVFNAGNAAGSAVGALILSRWGGEWLPVVSACLVFVSFVLVVTVPGTKTAVRLRQRRYGR